MTSLVSKVEGLLLEKVSLLAEATALSDRLQTVLGRVAVVEKAAVHKTKIAPEDKSVKWLAATTLAQFTALSLTVHPSALNHADLTAFGIARCTDRKVIMRRVAKLPTGSAPPAAAAAPTSTNEATKAGSGGGAPAATPSSDGGALPATVQEYFQDTYLFSGKGTVLAVSPAGNEGEEEGVFKVILNQTVFHPQGGGQPTDVGTMTVGAQTFTVEHVAMRSRECGVIEHTGKFTAGGLAFAVGATATLAVDEENRKLCARIHSAGHLLDAAMKATGRTDLEPSKGYHFSSGAYVEYIGKVEAADREPLALLLNKEINALIAVASDVKVQLPDAAGKTPRVVTMGGVSCPCGGTHVKNVREIKGVTVTKIKKSKKAVRVSYTIA